MKKIVCLILSLILIISVLAGCSNTKDNVESGNTDGTVTKDTTVKDNQDETKGEEDYVLKVWSFSDELKRPLEYFEEHYGIKTELTIIPTADYPTKVRPVLDSGVGAPDVFTGEIAWLKEWTEMPYWENLSESPYNVEEFASEYVPYAFDLGKDSQGNVRALTWQATPGGFMYKRYIAREVWGNDDPEFVGEKLSSLEKLFETAEELKQAGYRILPDESAMRHFAKGKDPKPWVNENNELQLTDAKIKYMDYMKTLREKDYTAMAPEWSPSWYASMAGPIGYNGGWNEVNSESENNVEVFGFVLPTWGLHYILKPNAGETAGDWGLTNGPVPYFWGGTWIGLYSGSEHKDLAWKFVEMMTHDEEFLNWWVGETGDLLSYKPVTDAVKDTMSDEFLAGQNHYEFFLSQADALEPGIVTRFDQGIDQIWGDLVGQYVEGTKTKEEAIQEFYSQVKNNYPDIKTP